MTALPPLPAPAPRVRGLLGRARVLPTKAALGLVWLYRTFVSPVLPRSCRYYPSCSVYAQQALRTHGLLRGGWLALRRLGRCHPWTPGGVDHVPGRDPAAGPAPSTASANHLPNSTGPAPVNSDSAPTGA